MTRTNYSVAAYLVSIIGEDGLVTLAETYGGTRLFVPQNIERSQIIDTLGSEIASHLSYSFGGNYLVVPLVRDIRARRYRTEGLSNAQIARKLGITEKGVERLFQRAPVKIRRTKKDDRQIDMFS